MLGRYHLTISLATASSVLFPFLMEQPVAAIIALTGVGIGSLVTDSDSKDATIFHSSVKGLDGRIGKLINTFVAPFFPLFGYTTRYLIYIPSVKILNLFSGRFKFEEHHRGFLHSVPGVVVSAAVTAAYALVLLQFLGFQADHFLGIFIISYSAGQILHLVEDSCTKTGISWFKPFLKFRIRGNVVTSPKFEHAIYPHALASVLWIAAFVVPGYVYFHNLDYSTVETAASGAIASGLIWLSFVIFVAKIRFNGS